MPFTINDQAQASVDVGSGNLMVSTLDRSASGINGMVNFGLAYQSLALASGSQVTKSTSEMQASTNSGTASGGGTPWSTFGVQDDLVKNWWKRGARWHDTRNGVWTSVDPITRLNDPTRANPYLYVGGDPINQIDPAGRDWWNPFSWGKGASCVVDWIIFIPSVPIGLTTFVKPTVTGVIGVVSTVWSVKSIISDCG